VREEDEEAAREVLRPVEPDQEEGGA